MVEEELENEVEDCFRVAVEEGRAEIEPRRKIRAGSQDVSVVVVMHFVHVVLFVASLVHDLQVVVGFVDLVVVEVAFVALFAPFSWVQARRVLVA